MNILVVVSSKHGATREIGGAIAEELRAGGHDVTEKQPDEVENLDGVAAVVLGSAVYMTQWMEGARNFISHYGEQLRNLPLWAFSVGLSGVPIGQVQDPRRIGPALLAIQPVDHRTFKGALDFGKLNLRERSVARLGNAPEGDYREWEKVREWARGIVRDLESGSIADR